jgi:hypothetical protein
LPNRCPINIANTYRDTIITGRASLLGEFANCIVSKVSPRTELRKSRHTVKIAHPRTEVYAP